MKHQHRKNLSARLAGTRELKKEFPRCQCILAISVGQPYHENRKLSATINLINKSHFKKCTIMIGDSLQRHTLQLKHDYTLEEAYQKSMEAGNDWLTRNQHYIKELQIPYYISRWNEWLKHPIYKKRRFIVELLYAGDHAYQKAFKDTVKTFLTRYQTTRDHPLDYDKAFTLCLEYLKEECAIIMPLWSDLRNEFILYPGKITPALSITHKKLVQTYHARAHLLEWLHLRFK